MAYPTICRENRSPAAQRYSHPWPVGIIGDIRYPDLVWAWRIEILLKQIGKYWVCVVGVCYYFELFHHFGTNTFPTHQSGHSVFDTADALGLQLFCDSGAAIGQTTSLMGDSDMHQKGSIGLFSGTFATLAPGITAISRHPQNPTHRLDLKHFAMILNESIALHFGVEKMAKAFFKMSLS